MFVNRPELYDIKTMKDDEGREIDTVGKAEIIIGKQRNGPPGTIWLAFNKDYISFERLAEESLAPIPISLPEETPF